MKQGTGACPKNLTKPMSNVHSKSLGSRGHSFKKLLLALTFELGSKKMMLKALMDIIMLL